MSVKGSEMKHNQMRCACGMYIGELFSFVFSVEVCFSKCWLHKHYYRMMIQMKENTNIEMAKHMELHLF